MTAKFSIATIEERLWWESDEPDTDPSQESDMSEFAPADLRDALDALERGCWDNIDWRASELIAYPADQHLLRDGIYESETLVIRARRPEWLDRLASAYEARKES